MSFFTVRNIVQDLRCHACPAKKRRLEQPSLRKAAHYRAALPYASDNGLQPFLSRKALRLLAVEYQDGLLHRLNDLTRGGPLEHLSLVDTIVETAEDRTQVLAFNYASQALNNAYFLTRLHDKPSKLDMGSSFGQAVASEFGSAVSLQHSFGSAVTGLMGSGWLWLVADNACKLGLVGTYGPGTILVQNRLQKGDHVGAISDVRIPVDGSALSSDVHTRPSATWPRAVNTSVATSLGEGVQDASRGLTIHSRPPKNPHAMPHTHAVSPPLRRSLSSSAMPFVVPQLSADRQSVRAISRKITSPYRALISDNVYPLLCLSVHEHAYMTDYGVWGKEEYTTRFWDVVDWTQVENTFANLLGMRDDGMPV